MGTDELRSEHLLLAVMRAAELPAARVLRTAGLTIEGVRSQVGRQSSRRRRYGRESPDTEELHRLVAAKVDEATGRRGQQIEVEDLLFAALSEPESGASQTVRELGGDPHEIARGLIALLTPEAGRGAPHDTPTATN
jgi:ATP-dependent Clp protease ATP-binding subunit ClpA